LTQFPIALQRAREAIDLATRAFADDDNVTGIAAVSMAAQLLQLAKLHELIAHCLDDQQP